ncbi:hypothetical protein AB4090_04770 [Acidithiobacillus sp. IBUN Pt1247-S3]
MACVKEVVPDSRTLSIAGWVASIITIACALVLSLDGNPPMRWMFVAWTISNVLWVWYGAGIKSGQVLASQAVFVLIDVIGLVHYWLY